MYLHEDGIMLKEGIYRHFKGNLYRLICIARHTETMEEMVVYQDVRQPEKCWARPACMWEETVEADGKTVPRFQYIAAEMKNTELLR